MRTKDNQRGFAAVETILIVIVLGIIGFTGWFVYHSKQATDKTLSSNADNSVTFPKKTATTQTPMAKPDTQKYLEVKEWGVKFPLSSSLESAVYTSDQYSTGTSSATGGSAKLGLLSLGSDCGSSSTAALGTYVEFTQADVNDEDANQIDPGTTSLHDLMKSAVEVPGSNGGYGSYYIAYVKPATDCSNGSDTVLVNAASAAFAQALKGVKSAGE